MCWRSVLALFTAYAFFPVVGSGQKACVNYRVQWLNTSSGLSQNTVNSIVRDRFGYMWVGTNHGLNRYDGRIIRTFSRSSSDGFSLGNNIVRCVAQLDNSIMAGTLDGITIFDPARDTSYIIHPEDFTDNKADKIVTALFDGASNHLLVGTISGVLLYDIATQKFVKHWPKKEFGIQPELYTFNTWNFIKSFDQILAFVGRNVYRFNSKSLLFTKISGAANSEVVFSGVQHVPGSDDLLCYGKNVLCLYDPVVNRYHDDMTPAIPVGTAPVVIESAVAISQAKIFAGVNNEGLYELSIDHPYIKSTRVLMDNASSFSGQNRFGSMIADLQGNLWVGTDYGVFYCSPNQYSIKHYVKNEAAGFVLSDNSLRSVQELTDGRILLGGSKGLSLFDPSQSRITTLQLPWQNATGKNLSYSVNAIEEYKGEIWVAGHMGLARIDASLNKMMVVPTRNEPRQASPSRVWGLYVADDTAWMCTLNGELFSYAISSNRLSMYKLPGGQTFFQVKKCGRYLVIAAFGGVYLFNTATHTFHFVKFPQQGRSVQVNALIQVDTNRWWVGTEGEGIFELNPTTMSFSAMEPILQGKVVYSMCCDRQHNVWVGCNDGLYKVSDIGQSLNHFTILDGLQENEFTYGKSAQLLTDGNILIGGVNGFNLFAPEKLQQRSSPVPVYLEQYKVNYQSRFHPLNEIRSVTVNYNEKLIQFHFTFPDPRMRNTIEYFAQIQGDDTAWRNLGGSGEWIFSDFRPGNYTIKVKACLAETGIAVSRANEFTFTVRPAYYQTLAFRLFLGLLAVGIVAFTFFYFYQRQSTTNKLLRARLSLAETEQQLAEANMSALRAQMNPHFIFNALASIQNLIFKNEKDASINYLQRFARMVRYILDKSRHELVEVEEEIRFLNSYLEMQQLRHQHMTMSIKNSLQQGHGHLYIPSMVVQPFLENSIEHAFPDKKDAMFIKVEFVTDNDVLKIVIADNGVGIYSAPSKTKRGAHESFGIEAVKRRLYNLGKKYSKKAHVLITDLSSRNETGTEVVLLLPIINTQTAYDQGNNS